MVKKILMALGVVFLLLVGLFVVLMVWAGKKGGEVQEKFFASVESGDPERVIALLNPELRNQVDAPVLAARMKLVASDLGPYKGMRMTDFHTSSNWENGVARIESAGTVDFEKGSAKSELVSLDGLFVKFHVASPQIPDKWFKGPVTTDLYRGQGKEFLEDFLRDNPSAAFARMHPSLQEKMPLDELKTKMAAATAKAGPLKSVEYTSESLDADNGYSLAVLYHVTCERQETTAKVKFQFVGLKGHLIGYDLAVSGK